MRDQLNMTSGENGTREFAMTRAKPTATEIADEDARSTELGYFNFAESYRVSAKVLDEAGRQATDIESPIRFLYYHAVELYLKSYLRSHCVSAYRLRTREFGHDAGKLSRKCEALGLTLDGEDREVVRLMTETDAVIRSRYITTGCFQWPSTEALERTCYSLRESLAQRLIAQGHKLRL
jgi:hypothetical protein